MSMLLLLAILSGSAVDQQVVVSSSGAADQQQATLVTMGEVMLRFSPIDAEDRTAEEDPTRHTPHPFLRSLGGDELNVAVALRLLGIGARWISVLPTGPLGDVVTASCAHYDVQFAGPRVPNSDLGTFYVLPEERTVHYQRRHSAFALHDPEQLDWSTLLDTPQPWLHVTGITPLISEAARRSWERALGRAAEASIPTSCDLNHRKQLGTLAQLWTIAAPHVPRLELLILSLEQLNGLALIELGEAAAPPPLAVDADDADYFALMERLQLRWKCRRLVLCRKVRDASGVQVSAPRRSRHPEPASLGRSTAPPAQRSSAWPLALCSLRSPPRDV